ncbi:MAG TPA: polysaccharide biosynthesis C-terminal domain-containing protein, partial [Syntrophomonadaceae bacterium]|nr:polysaccharide biosynthesis C-terminal domain-containing protein [Syntrophomonadaceae bacterium]
KFNIPMRVSIICITLNIVLNTVFLDYGIIAISAGTAMALLLYAVIMGLMLKREIGSFMEEDFFTYLARLAIPILCMLAIIFGFKYLGFTGIIMGFLLPLSLSGITYLLVAHFTKLTSEFNLREASNR